MFLRYLRPEGVVFECGCAPARSKNCWLLTIKSLGKDGVKEDICINNLIAIDKDLKRISISDDLDKPLHRWFPADVCLEIDGIPHNADMIAFATGAHDILLTSPNLPLGLTLPSEPFKGVHSSNETYRDGGKWCAEYNNNEQYWAYTCISLQTGNVTFKSWSQLFGGSRQMQESNLSPSSSSSSVVPSAPVQEIPVAYAVPIMEAITNTTHVVNKAI